ncbi:Guanylate kinase/L-type calcium channel beta subunit [Trinorchestia longiramus]|nr:Guanylate kinase/L-type calcium channel beta subunit [Trinorchestia longiramus]
MRVIATTRYRDTKPKPRHTRQGHCPELPHNSLAALQTRDLDLGVVLGCRLYVKEIVRGSLAAKNGQLREGDELVKINNSVTDNLSLKEARKLLDSHKEELQLVVRRHTQSPPSAVSAAASLAPVNKEACVPNRGLGYPAQQNLYVQPPSRPTDPSAHYSPPPLLDSNNHNMFGGVGPSSDFQYGSAGEGGGMSSPPDSGAASLPPRPPLPRPEDYYPHRAPTNSSHAPDGSPIKPQGPVPEPRYVSFRKEGSVGIRLTGGNEVGIFVTAVQPGSQAQVQGIVPGDKVLKVNDMDLTNMTREDAVLYLMSQQDQIDLLVQTRLQDYQHILASQKGDLFYIKTHFHYDPEGTGELSFRSGDIFRVVDTLHGGVVGAWQVERMGRNNQETQRGTIPNKARAEELATAQFNAAKKEQTQSESRSGFFKRRRNSRRSKSLGKDHWEDVMFGESMSKFPAYERVSLQHPGFVRPVVLFGPLADVARTKLLTDNPDKFSSPQLDSNGEKHQASIIRLSAIREIVERGKHAVLDITPSAVDRLNYAQFYPIVIYLRVDSKQAVKEMRAGFPKGRQSSKKLYEQSLKVERLWGHVFTSTLTLTQPDTWPRKLAQAIAQHQAQPVWMAQSKPLSVCRDPFLLSGEPVPFDGFSIAQLPGSVDRTMGDVFASGASDLRPNVVTTSSAPGGVPANEFPKEPRPTPTPPLPPTPVPSSSPLMDAYDFVNPHPPPPPPPPSTPPLLFVRDQTPQAPQSSPLPKSCLDHHIPADAPPPPPPKPPRFSNRSLGLSPPWSSSKSNAGDPPQLLPTVLPAFANRVSRLFSSRANFLPPKVPLKKFGRSQPSSDSFVRAPTIDEEHSRDILTVVPEKEYASRSPDNGRHGMSTHDRHHEEPRGYGPNPRDGMSLLEARSEFVTYPNHLHDIGPQGLPRQLENLGPSHSLMEERKYLQRQLELQQKHERFITQKQYEAAIMNQKLDLRDANANIDEERALLWRKQELERRGILNWQSTAAETTWPKEPKPAEALSDDFLFPMTSRLSYASSPESDLEGGSDPHTPAHASLLSSSPSSPMTQSPPTSGAPTPNHGALLGGQRSRLVKSSSDPSIAGPEDVSSGPYTGPNSGPYSYGGPNMGAAPPPYTASPSRMPVPADATSEGASKPMGDSQYGFGGTAVDGGPPALKEPGPQPGSSPSHSTSPYGLPQNTQPPYSSSSPPNSLTYGYGPQQPSGQHLPNGLPNKSSSPYSGVHHPHFNHHNRLPPPPPGGSSGNNHAAPAATSTPSTNNNPRFTHNQPQPPPPHPPSATSPSAMPGYSPTKSHPTMVNGIPGGVNRNPNNLNHNPSITNNQNHNPNITNHNPNGVHGAGFDKPNASPPKIDRSNKPGKIRLPPPPGTEFRNFTNEYDTNYTNTPRSNREDPQRKMGYGPPRGSNIGPNAHDDLKSRYHYPPGAQYSSGHPTQHHSRARPGEFQPHYQRSSSQPPAYHGEDPYSMKPAPPSKGGVGKPVPPPKPRHHPRGGGDPQQQQQQQGGWLRDGQTAGGASNGRLSDDYSAIDSGHGSSLERKCDTFGRSGGYPKQSQGSQGFYLNVPMPSNRGDGPKPGPGLELPNHDHRGSAFELYKKPADPRARPQQQPPPPQQQQQQQHFYPAPDGHPNRCAGEEESEGAVVSTVRGYFDDQGGVLSCAATGVSLHIPKGAIKPNSVQEIYFKVCQDDSVSLSSSDRNEGEKPPGPLVLCGPRGVKFERPVSLRLPVSSASAPTKTSTTASLSLSSKLMPSADHKKSANLFSRSPPLRFQFRSSKSQPHRASTRSLLSYSSSSLASSPSRLFPTTNFLPTNPFADTYLSSYRDELYSSSLSPNPAWAEALASHKDPSRKDSRKDLDRRNSFTDRIADEDVDDQQEDFISVSVDHF